VILNGVISAPFKYLGYFSPLIVETTVEEEKNLLFLQRPGTFLYLRIQVIVPSFSTMLADTRREVLGNNCPLLSPYLLD
jgi:hypothetical protein